MFRILQRITIIKCTAFDLFPFVVFLFIAKSQSFSYFCLQLTLIYFDASWHEPLFPKFQMYFMGAKMQQPTRSELDGSLDSIWYCRARLQNEDGAPDAIWIIRTRHILMQLKEVPSYIYFTSIGTRNDAFAWPHSSLRARL